MPITKRGSRVENPGRSVKLGNSELHNCCVEVPSQFEELAPTLLDSLVELGYISSYTLFVKNGTTFVSAIASESQLHELNKEYDLDAQSNWKGSLKASWPSETKRSDGSAWNHWLGVKDPEE